ncbi:MAG: hypothetical protein M1839_008124 [Geoglossum umbratile]|nr:MAG: hypothetical protein M1839_008124 [Geoglossum umbratile]
MSQKKGREESTRRLWKIGKKETGPWERGARRERGGYGIKGTGLSGGGEGPEAGPVYGPANPSYPSSRSAVLPRSCGKVVGAQWILDAVQRIPKERYRTPYVDFRFQASAIGALQEATEAFIVGLSRKERRNTSLRLLEKEVETCQRRGRRPSLQRQAPHSLATILITKHVIPIPPIVYF